VSFGMSETFVVRKGHTGVANSCYFEEQRADYYSTLPQSQDTVLQFLIP